MTDSPEAPIPVSATPERVAKVIARSGVASRRDAEKMILAGRVAINGKKIDTPAIDVSPSDRVTIDGQPIDAPQETRVWLYYKPLGLVTTEKDEQGRRTIFDEMPEGMPRVLNVGRLDLNSEGLLLLTNDGGLKRRLELPETGWLRKYRVRVNGRPMADAFDPLRRGITIDGEEFQPMEISLDRQQGANAWLTVGIREGKNREIRRAMSEIGLTVNRLIRLSYGPFRLNDMKPGDVVEVKRKVLREQMGDRLLLGVEDGRKSRTEREEAALAARAERFARSDARRDGGRPERGAREDGGDRKGFGKQRDFGGDRGERGFKPRREDGDRPFRPKREDGERGEVRPRREDGERGAKPLGAKPFGGKPFGAKPRAAGFKSHRDEERGGERGERRSFGDRPPREGGREGGFGAKPFGGKPRGEGFRGDRPRDDRPRDDRPREDRPREDRPRGDFKGGKPFGAKRFDGDRPERGDRPYTPRGDKPYGDKPRAPRGAEGGFGDKKPYGARGDKPYAPRGDKPYGDKPRGDKPFARRDGDKPYGDKPRGDKPFARRDGDKPYGDKPRGDKPFGERSGKPYTPREGGRDGKPGGFKSQGFKSHGGSPGGKPRAEGSKSHGGRAMTGFNRGPAKPRKD